MKIESYEKNYVVSKEAEKVLSKIKPVVEFLSQHSGEAMTCKAIGVAMYGDNYNPHGCWWERNQNPELYMTSQKLGNILSHLVELGLVKREQIDGEPVEIEHEKYVCANDEKNEPYYITVKDELGRTFDIANPYYRSTPRRGEWQTVKETITPKINAYIWVGGAIL